MDGNLYYNSGSNIFLRIDGIYYKREMEHGWKSIAESQLPADAKWSPLHENQLSVYKRALIDAKLISE